MLDRWKLPVYSALAMNEANTTTRAYGRVFKQDSGSRHHGSSKVVHVLTVDADGMVKAPCSPGDVGIVVERFTVVDVSCEKCKRLR